jgi:hypothetical protein
MSKNITHFRGNVAAPALRAARAHRYTPHDRVDIRRTQPQVPVRDVLYAVWRTNPASGRLECRWMTERSAATDEGVSCNDLLRRAA